MTTMQSEVPKKIRNRRKKLIAALRSGKYKQTTAVLEKRTARGKPYATPICCAMGVARYVWSEARDRFDKETTMAGFNGDRKKLANQAATVTICLPDAIARYFGYGDKSHHIMNWNDAGHSFSEIADRLEAQIDNVVLEDQ